MLKVIIYLCFIIGNCFSLRHVIMDYQS
uniref:Uncharacterized protein n=1 Tax=Arundo donax TaxID=35708 RepID=A0A0A9F5K6_ARUDO